MMVRTLEACNTTICMACASMACGTTTHAHERGVKVGLVWIWGLTLISGLKKMTRKVQDGACVAAPLFWDSVLCR
ncbi:hypothetical protein DZC30_08265 [Comamonas testosteroni]|uniref:Secreted protein n=1 Tax=Comamonas testosteroni TaxID=285 RepID=A0A373FQE1_COMTE|nr:hypothetical protein DZC30_08265 [Comamonas testosteroni]